MKKDLFAVTETFQSCNRHAVIFLLHDIIPSESQTGPCLMVLTGVNWCCNVSAHSIQDVLVYRLGREG